MHCGAVQASSDRVGALGSSRSSHLSGRCRGCQSRRADSAVRFPNPLPPGLEGNGPPPQRNLVRSVIVATPLAYVDLYAAIDENLPFVDVFLFKPLDTTRSITC